MSSVAGTGCSPPAEKAARAIIARVGIPRPAGALHLHRDAGKRHRPARENQAFGSTQIIEASQRSGIRQPRAPAGPNGPRSGGFRVATPFCTAKARQAIGAAWSLHGRPSANAADKPGRTPRLLYDRLPGA